MAQLERKKIKKNWWDKFITCFCCLYIPDEEEIRPHYKRINY
jgi:hypothetical protein